MSGSQGVAPEPTLTRTQRDVLYDLWLAAERGCVPPGRVWGGACWSGSYLVFVGKRTARVLEAAGLIRVVGVAVFLTRKGRARAKG
jgi:hypothetical protein